MGITYDNHLAVFHDTVSVEEAEDLLQWIQKHPDGQADFATCTHIHAAGLQVLMAARIGVAAWPRDETLRTWLTGPCK